jgi:hypothetical protein
MGKGESHRHRAVVLLHDHGIGRNHHAEMSRRRSPEGYENNQNNQACHPMSRSHLSSFKMQSGFKKTKNHERICPFWAAPSWSIV